MSDYTPTTDDVRDMWSWMREDIADLPMSEGVAEFDRWLAAHDEDVRRQEHDGPIPLPREGARLRTGATAPIGGVRDAWARMHPFPSSTELEERYAEFDRMLAAERQRGREEAANALADCLDAMLVSKSISPMTAKALLAAACGYGA